MEGKVFKMKKKKKSITNFPFVPPSQIEDCI